MFLEPFRVQVYNGGCHALRTHKVVAQRPRSGPRRALADVFRMGGRFRGQCHGLGRDGGHPQGHRLARSRSLGAVGETYACHTPAARPSGDEQVPAAAEHPQSMKRVGPGECLKVFGANVQLDGGQTTEFRRTLAATWTSYHSKRPLWGAKGSWKHSLSFGRSAPLNYG